jgi:hypothetical protein
MDQGASGTNQGGDFNEFAWTVFCVCIYVCVCVCVQSHTVLQELLKLNFFY